MSRFVAIRTDMEAPHTLCWSASGTIGTSGSHVEVPAYVPFALEAQLVLFELLWAVLLCPA